MKIFYNRILKLLSRSLRNNSTLSEVPLWKQLKGRRMKGYPFMRQKPIKNYIVDFYCSKLKLVIEVDGISHAGKEDADKMRQNEIESLGITFLRLDDKSVKTQMLHILRVIDDFIEELELKQNLIQPPNALC